MSNVAAQLVQAKLRQMDEQIRFFEYVWGCMTQDERDFYTNNYRGPVPPKYNK